MKSKIRLYKSIKEMEKAVIRLQNKGWKIVFVNISQSPFDQPTVHLVKNKIKIHCIVDTIKNFYKMSQNDKK